MLPTSSCGNEAGSEREEDMTDSAAAPRERRDGSAYEAHLAGIAERNLAVKKAGRARRAEDDLRKTRLRIESDRRTDAELSARR